MIFWNTKFPERFRLYQSPSSPTRCDGSRRAKRGRGWRGKEQEVRPAQNHGCSLWRWDFFAYFKSEKLFTSNLIPFLKLIMIGYFWKKIQTKKARRRNRLKRPENGRCNPHWFETSNSSTVTRPRSSGYFYSLEKFNIVQHLILNFLWLFYNSKSNSG